MKRPNTTTLTQGACVNERAAPVHSLTVGSDVTRRHTLNVAERQALAATVALRAASQPMAAITQPLSPVRADAVTAPLLASAVFTPRPGGGRRA